jgi:hypothetical protein
VRGFAIGDRVSQAQYGNGTVAAANEYHTTIDFDDHGMRTFSTAVVKLERSTSLAPVKAKATRRKSTKRAAAAVSAPAE